ncbi:MAG: hypothetical protein JXB48_04690 [Candidatus Latescibacteria bacterium]|nr:hypothetical protein [Candidatus Latescibacterota bacterium]
MIYKLMLILCVVPLLGILLVGGCGNSTPFEENGDEDVIGIFTVFTLDDGLTDTGITDVAYDRWRNGVWCTTLRGISFYSMSDSTWTKYDSDPVFPKLEFRTITVDDITGTVWAGTISGAVFYNDSGWETIDELLGMYINSITIMADRSVWFGTRNGIEVMNENGWEYYSVLSGLSHDTVSTITTDSKGNVWVGTINGISVFDGDNWSVVASGALSDAFINKILRRSDGTMWCGTLNGVSVYNGTSWKKYGIGLPNPAVNDILETDNNVLWAATDSGIATFSGSTWKAVELPQAVRYHPVTSLTLDTANGDVWIATTAGVVRYSTEKQDN